MYIYNDDGDDDDGDKVDDGDNDDNDVYLNKLQRRCHKIYIRFYTDQPKRHKYKKISNMYIHIYLYICIHV
jgi:hypothetical protein